MLDFGNLLFTVFLPIPCLLQYYSGFRILYLGRQSGSRNERHEESKRAYPAHIHIQRYDELSRRIEVGRHVERQPDRRIGADLLEQKLIRGKLVSAGDVERHNADRSDHYRERKNGRRLGYRFFSYAVHIDDDLFLMSERGVHRDEQYEQRSRLYTSARTARADADEHQHYGQRLRKIGHARLRERTEPRGTRRDRLEKRVDDLIAERHPSHRFGIVVFRGEKAHSSDKYQRRRHWDHYLGVQFQPAPSAGADHVGHDHKTYTAQDDEYHRDYQDEGIGREHGIRRPFRRRYVESCVAERHNAVENTVPDRRPRLVIARKRKREQQRARKLDRRGHLHDIEGKAFEVVHAFVRQFFGHAQAFAQRYLMSYEEIYGRGDRHESESAYLDEKKYDDLSESRKIGIEILYHEPRHASGAGRGKKCVYERERAGRRSGRRYHQKRGADQYHRREAEHYQPYRGENSLGNISYSKLSVHRFLFAVREHYTPYRAKRQPI